MIGLILASLKCICQTKYRSLSSLFPVGDDGWSHFSKHLIKKNVSDPELAEEEEGSVENIPPNSLMTIAIENFNIRFSEIIFPVEAKSARMGWLLIVNSQMVSH